MTGFASGLAVAGRRGAPRACLAGRAARAGRPGREGRRGFTMVELLVAMVSGMALVLGVTVMLMRFESGRRTLTSLSATETGAAYAGYVLDRLVRSAGSGFLRSGPETLGCELRASRSGTAVLPRGSAFPAPFAAVPGTLRLVPLIAFAGAGANGSDVLLVSTGASGLGEVPLRVLPGSAADAELRVPATLGLRGGDLLLVSQDGMGCMVQQLSAGFVGGADQRLTLGGAYAASTIAGQRLADMAIGQNAWATPLGNANASPPVLRLIGLGDNATLVSHDPLRMGGSDAVQPEADGVVNLRLRYGVDANGDGAVDTWIAPDAAGWTGAALMDGSAQSQERLRSILAVRLALVVRDPLTQREETTASVLRLFEALPTALQVDHAVGAADRLHRHRVIEFTVPLRNAML